MFNTVVVEITKYLGGNTDNKTLDEYGVHLLNDYVGTFASDRIPILQDGQCAIVNLDSTGQPGSHWVAIYHEGKTHFYDSFGRQADTIISGDYIESPDFDAEQTMIEMNCGSYSMAWLYCFERFGKDYAMTI